MIYVDRYPDWIVHHKPYWLGGGHLFGTNLNELHNFARLIGLKKEWYQGSRLPHYDLTKSKRDMAIQYGAYKVAPGIIPKGVVTYDPAYRYLSERSNILPHRRKKK